MDSWKEELEDLIEEHGFIDPKDFDFGNNPNPSDRRDHLRMGIEKMTIKTVNV